MTVTSALYALFVALVVPLVRVLRARWREVALVVASLGFYAYADWRYAAGAVVITMAVWVLGGRARESKAAFVAGLLVPISALTVFKYAAWGTESLNAGITALLHAPGLPVPELIAPLGVSFISFGLVHYMVEMRRGEAPRSDALEMLAYAFFFPTVVSGPIKRYPAFIEDLRTPSTTLAEDVRYGMLRIVFGLVKKVVLADTLALLTVPLLKGDTEPVSALVIAVYAYAFQIWLDFSGYSDIAIGVSRLLGFRIIENFDRPYTRTNIAAFWRTWHMSLTRLITEYVFIPLGGSRVGKARTALNTLIAMGVSGLWHGAAWHFVVWGLYHGVGLVIQRWFKEAVGWVKRHSPATAHVFAHPALRALTLAASLLLTFNFVALGWVLFAVDVDVAMRVYRALATWAIGLVR